MLLYQRWRYFVVWRWQMAEFAWQCTHIFTRSWFLYNPTCAWNITFATFKCVLTVCTWVAWSSVGMSDVSLSTFSWEQILEAEQWMWSYTFCTTSVWFFRSSITLCRGFLYFTVVDFLWVLHLTPVGPHTEYSEDPQNLWCFSLFVIWWPDIKPVGLTAGLDAPTCDWYDKKHFVSPKKIRKCPKGSKHGSVSQLPVAWQNMWQGPNRWNDEKCEYCVQTLGKKGYRNRLFLQKRSNQSIFTHSSDITAATTLIGWAVLMQLTLISLPLINDLMFYKHNKTEFHIRTFPDN